MPGRRSAGALFISSIGNAFGHDWICREAASLCKAPSLPPPPRLAAAFLPQTA
jgi:hypothetical protein